MLSVKFPCGNVIRCKKNSLLSEIINKFDSSYLDSYAAVKVNKNIFDFRNTIVNDSSLFFISPYSYDGIKIIRRSCLLLLGYAIKKLCPSSKIATSCIVDNGFFCDVDFEKSFNNYDLKKIEDYIFNIINTNVYFAKQNVSWETALEIFKKFDDVYKIFFLKNKINKNDVVTLYKCNDYIFLSRGPCVYNTNLCSNFKLHKISGAYWLNSNNNKMLQRIYGVSFVDKKQLSLYVKNMEKVKNRDHRKISKQLDLFHITRESPGMVFWHSNGLTIIKELKAFIRLKLCEYMYQEVKTPVILDRIVWEKTGHWKNYKENIFNIILNDNKFCVKPMNCPGHASIFSESVKSYRDLPFRLAEFGNCYRNETSGGLYGLMRLREFIQDDAHIFCTEDQILHEIKSCINMIYDIYKIFGFKNILVKLSTKPKNRIGTDEQWKIAENSLIDSLGDIKYVLQKGDGAFYGPKIEFVLNDCLNRDWQCGTIQLDFFLSSCLNIFYIDKNNTRKFPVVIHRAILGSIERFVGILIEHYAGFLPLWLSPLQVVILSVHHEQKGFIVDLKKKLCCVGIRAFVDHKNESINFKIRKYTMQRVPYMLICGKKEASNNKISVRTYKGKDLGSFSIEEFIKKILLEIKYKNINSIFGGIEY